MSHYTQVKTEIRHVTALVNALRAMGYDHVEVHESAQLLESNWGVNRREVAEVIIRRRYIGPGASDIGFQRQPSGEFVVIVDDIDRSRYCPESWMNRLTARYARDRVLASLEQQGVRMEDVIEREEADGSYTFEVSLDDEQLQTMIGG